MKSLLKFSVLPTALDGAYNALHLIPNESPESKVKEEDETLELFSGDVDKIRFILSTRYPKPNRTEVVTLEFIDDDLKYMYIRGAKFLVCQINGSNDFNLFATKPIEGIAHLPELFQHRIKYLSENAGEKFLQWDLQKEIEGCELAAATYDEIFESTKFLTEADFAKLGHFTRESENGFMEGCPLSFVMAMGFALQTCRTGVLNEDGRTLVRDLEKFPPMFLPICGDVDGIAYQPNVLDISYYINTQIW